MSDPDQVFPAPKARGGNSNHSERRFITGRPRRGAAGGGGPKVVEVVHVQRVGAGGAASNQPRPADRSLRAETWSEGFHARPAAPAQYGERPPTPEPSAPVMHVMPAWAPAPQPEPPPVAPLAEPSAETSTAGRRDGAARRPRAGWAEARRFADPFAAGDDGANCLRCGYLVEPARERRGLVTCAAYR